MRFDKYAPVDLFFDGDKWGTALYVGRVDLSDVNPKIKEQQLRLNQPVLLLDEVECFLLSLAFLISVFVECRGLKTSSWL